MNVSLTPKLEKWIATKVKGGKYQTASEVVREALRLCMENDEKLKETRRLVQEGIDDFEAGRVSTMSMEEIKQEARRRFHEKRAQRELKRVG